MAEQRPDALDEINAYRAGYRHGRDEGKCTAQTAPAILRQLPTTIPIVEVTVAMFCRGLQDGARGDAVTYLLSYGVAP